MDSGKIALVAAVVSAAVSILIILVRSLVLDRWYHLFKLEQEYRYEQRKKIKDILARNKVQLLNQCEDLSHRMWNLRHNYQKEWHHVSGVFHDPGNRYFFSSIYRVVAVLAWIRKTEKEMCYLDTTEASPADLDFVAFLRLLPTILTDVQLFKGVAYNESVAKDHFFKNDLHSMADEFLDNGEVIQFSEFSRSPEHTIGNLEQVCRFVDGISPGEKRLRWDRMQAFHLTLIAFLNMYGYSYQRTSDRKTKSFVTAFDQRKILENFYTIVGEFHFCHPKNIKIWRRMAKATNITLQWKESVLEQWRND
jgi:hypothetical protein